MGGGTSKTTTTSSTQSQQPLVDPITQLSPQYVITGGIIRLKKEVEHEKNKQQNEVQMIHSDFPKRIESETKESVIIGHTSLQHHTDVPVVEDFDDTGSVVGMQS